MLQQTQVTTVIPYFERWLQRFPDLAALANAELDEVLALWTGLGYYARARNLHRAARLCAEQHGGELPVDPRALAGLPGIGESTANAIVSQAHDRPLPILDGNARRVLARHAAIDGWPGKASVLKKFWSEASLRVPASRGADYTQAIMDLGATVCTRSRPGCERCPVASDCRALRSGEVALYPARKPKIAVREMDLFMLLLRRADGAVLLERRPPAGIWGGLWAPPTAESADALGVRFGLDEKALTELEAIEHRLTHRRLRIHALHTDEQPAPCINELHQKWLKRDQLSSVGLPRPVLELLLRH